MLAIYLFQNSETKELYFCITNNLKRRLEEHNNGHQTSTRRLKGRWIPIYIEIYRAKEDAVLREQRIKNHGSGKHELLKRLRKSKFA